MDLVQLHLNPPPPTPTNVDYVFVYCTNYDIYHERREQWT